MSSGELREVGATMTADQLDALPVGSALHIPPGSAVRRTRVLVKLGNDEWDELRLMSSRRVRTRDVAGRDEVAHVLAVGDGE